MVMSSNFAHTYQPMRVGYLVHDRSLIQDENISKSSHVLLYIENVSSISSSFCP